jgi:hypothetical protein
MGVDRNLEVRNKNGQKGSTGNTGSLSKKFDHCTHAWSTFLVVMMRETVKLSYRQSPVQVSVQKCHPSLSIVPREIV